MEKQRPMSKMPLLKKPVCGAGWPKGHEAKKEDEKNQSASKRQRHSFSDNFQSPDNPLSNLQNFHILTRSQKRKQAAQTIEIKIPWHSLK
ncbi:MAG: hypothetical protein HWD59_03990 [Coxiellaceae bacterium]|nr:MAG: hypothetical protein HWD59_03990 [Coxiellaceae bacterium]